MTGSTTRRLLVAAVLVLAPLAVLSPAGAEVTGTTPQTIHFTSDPPTDAIVGYRYLYGVTAESSSGLPVVYSGDPSSDVCSVYDEEPFIYGNVSPDHAGTCTVHVDQPGNGVYAPAPRITMTFQIGREATFLYPAKASKGVLGTSYTTFKANLTQRGWYGPGYGAEFAYTDQLVVFRVGGKVMCTGTTVFVDDGSIFGAATATCRAKIGLNLALKYNSYTATYGGSRDYLPSTATRKFGG
jgi:hypothetical protein